MAARRATAWAAVKRLGAILAGGQARRFGGDKAAALAGGVPLIERVATALAPQCAALVVVGRDWPGLPRIEDLPAPGLGPLGALAGALAYAEAHGFDEVLTSGCDLPDVPEDLAVSLAPAPAVIEEQPLLGLWPSAVCATLLARLERDSDRAVRGWVAASGARLVPFPGGIVNINTRAELAIYEARSGDS